MKVKVNKETCIGCGACTVIADKIFEIGEDGLSQLINEEETQEAKEVPEEEIENVTDACESCPTGAIEIIEE